jgi:MFS transporter, PPP family, 3-phenylpropionic acid transporter
MAYELLTVRLPKTQNHQSRRKDPVPASNLTIRISATMLYAGLFIFTGAYAPYFPIWLDHQGFSKSELTTILGAPILIRMVAPPIMGWFAERYGIVVTLMVCHLTAAASIVFLFLFDGFWPVLLVSSLVGFVLAPAAALIDAALGYALNDRPAIAYGQVRSFGSVFFMLTNIGVGAALGMLIPNGLLLVMLAGCLIAAATLPLSTRVLAIPKRRQATNSGETARPLPYVMIGLVALAAAFIQASHAFFYAFGTIEWQRLGVTDTGIGFAWAAGVLSEIVIFYVLGSRLQTASQALLLMILGSISGIVRWSIYAMGVPNDAWPLVQLLHGANFGLTHLASVTLINLLAPERRALGHSLVAFAIAIAMAAATFTSDELYVAFGPASYYVSSVLSALGLPFIALAMHRLRLYPQSALSGGKTVLPS